MSAQRTNAIGLAAPNIAAAVDGRPKIPAPMIPLIASPVRSQRFIARSSEGFAVLVCVTFIMARLS